MKTNKYIALLRGINVGGKAKLSMSDLKSELSDAGFEAVSSYINSGNIIFSSPNRDTDRLAREIETIIAKKFRLNVDVIVLSKSDWLAIIKNAPGWWGHDTTRKHNLIVLLKPYNMLEVLAAIGELKPGIESAEAGNGVIYQSLSLQDFGKTTTGKLAANPIYKRMTIRNFNTATKLLHLLD